MRYKFLLFLCIGYAPLSAQNWEVYGVIRSTTGEVVPGASVYIDDTTGVVSNEQGQYKIVSAQRPRVLIVQQLSHFSRRILLQADTFSNRRLRLDVVLTAQFVALPQVDIVSPKVEVLLEEDFTNDLFDYEFAGENLLLLLRRNRQHVLRLVGESGEVLTEMVLAGNPRSLHRSCTGGLHAVGSDIVQELILNSLQLDTFPRYPAGKFRSIIEPCVLKNDRYYVYRKSAVFNQAVYYWYFDTYGGRHPLTEILNRASIREAYRAYRYFLYNMPFTVRPEKTPYSESIDKGFQLDAFPDEYDVPLNIQALLPLALSANQNAWLGVLKTIESDSNYAPMFKIGDRILVFDHINGEIRQFDDAFRKEDAIPIAYQKGKGWKKELLKDDVTQAMYAHFAPDGRHELQKIDVSTGNTLKSYPLDEVLYLSHHFKIRDGYLYYLGQENVNIPNYKLFKVNIAQQSKR
ncbi:MAG: hypothetical protein IT262_14685 [Saprospiraceae bacterium]|nr:hypothetical protein [Saprospiraceae bacterium]